MTQLTLNKLSTAWLKAREQEEKRVTTPPQLRVYAEKEGFLEKVADDLDDLREAIKFYRNLQIRLPNRLRIKIFPAVEDRERLAVYTVGNFRDVSIMTTGGIGTTTLDLGPSAQAKRFERDIAEPFAKSFGCQFGRYHGMFQNITLAPVTSEQANILVKAVLEFKSDQAPPKPSFIRITGNTIRHLIK